MSILAIGFLLFGIFLIGASTHPSEETPAKTTSRAQTFELNLIPLPLQKQSSQSLKSHLEHQAEPEKLDETFHWIEGEVARNQSLSNLMSREGIKLKMV